MAVVLVNLWSQYAEQIDCVCKVTRCLFSTTPEVRGSLHIMLYFRNWIDSSPSRAIGFFSGSKTSQVLVPVFNTYITGMQPQEGAELPCASPKSRKTQRVVSERASKCVWETVSTFKVRLKTFLYRLIGILASNQRMFNSLQPLHWTIYYTGLT